MGNELKTWTFVGHWEGDRIVVEYALEGVVDDEREDCGRWPEGLWAAAAEGRTEEEAERNARAEYEPDAVRWSAPSNCDAATERP